jgi:UDP-N-acetylglucosamine pyrophosphorylase
MNNPLIETITNSEDKIRNSSITALLKNASLKTLIKYASDLEQFRQSTGNLYHKVRACLFLFVIYRFYLQEHIEVNHRGEITFDGVQASFDRKFELSISIYLDWIDKNGLDGSLCSAIGETYYQLGFSYLFEQVKSSISNSTENILLFNTRNLESYPYRVPNELSFLNPNTGQCQVGMDACPVRLDPSHSSWSDIFFLGMDFPEGARVVNISVDLKIHGDKSEIIPPCECYSQTIDEPIIHLISTDLNADKKVSTLSELFNFGNDYLSLLKAGVVASGIIPPSFEGTNLNLSAVLHQLIGRPGGLKIITRVNNIPKGSRLAVSTTLLATIITRLMRMSGQILNQTGSITEQERRIVASRAILGEWLGGSGGGWQDSGGLWPGIKIITGKSAGPNDPELGISRGCLLPTHRILSRTEVSSEIENKIVDSMVLVHGGISQDVGPILEMVTEKYLLKYENQWQARLEGNDLFDKIVKALLEGNIQQMGALTTRDWNGPLQKIIPWINNAFTQDLIIKLNNKFNEDYWGFLMLGGMSGGGMAFLVNPAVKNSFKSEIGKVMKKLKETYRLSYPFIIDPVVYDFKINYDGIIAQIFSSNDKKLPEQFFSKISAKLQDSYENEEESKIKTQYGFNTVSHEHMRTQLKSGKIGLSKNRLPITTDIRDVNNDEIQHFEMENSIPELEEIGRKAISQSRAGVVTFAGGMGSRWTEGAAVVKAINPFVKMAGKYRTFIEIHLAKSRKTAQLTGNPVPHAFTTSYLTHNAITDYLKHSDYFGAKDTIYLSPGKSIGRRVYPMQRDLNFFWKEQLQQKLDDKAQKVQDDLRQAMIEWTRSKGEGSDYAENRTMLRFNPPGHWYEIPNLIKNNTLSEMLRNNQNLDYLLCHNIDTMGAELDNTLLGMHINSGSCMTFEVTPRRIIDQGGGLAKVNGRLQLIEGTALPRDEDEFRLSYYNTLTHWISIDSLLDFFSLDRQLLLDAPDNPKLQQTIIKSIHEIEKKIPTYVTIKNVKYLWGSGQEDIYPVAQFEKLWGDMTVLDNLPISYVAVSRYRGQQLKEPSHRDMWFQDGSYDNILKKTSFS